MPVGYTEQENRVKESGRRREEEGRDGRRQERERRGEKGEGTGWESLFFRVGS